MCKLGRQIIRRQIISRQFFLKRKISRLKTKTGPISFELKNLCRPRRIRYIQAKCAGDAKNMNDYELKLNLPEE